jgi:hypothetical protein
MTVQLHSEYSRYRVDKGIPVVNRYTELTNVHCAINSYK